MPKRITNNTKTDFIVNMTRAGFMKLCLCFLTLGCVGVGFCCLPYYIKLGNKYMSGGYDEFMSLHGAFQMAAELLEYAPIILMAFGFFGYLILLIAGTKKYFKFKENMPVLLLFLYIVLCAASAVSASDMRIALFGIEGRYEGLIFLIACSGLFVAAGQLADKISRIKLICVIVAVSTVHAAVGIFQGLKATFEIFPSFYSSSHNISGLLSENFVANGFTASPFALASLLSMASALCLGGIMYSDRKGLKVFFAVCGAVITLGGLLTKTLTILVGLSAGIITLAVLEIVRIKTGRGLFVKGMLNNPLGKLVLSAVVMAGIFAVLIASGNFSFEDTYIVLQDSFYRLFLSRPNFRVDGVKIYPQLWKQAAIQIKDSFVFGAGPDCIAASENLVNIGGSADRYANEYLNIAVHTGVPSLVMYIGFLVSCAVRGAKGVGKFFDRKDSFARAAAFAACAGYIAAGMFSNASLVSTPIFFIMLGLCFSKEAE